MRKKAIAPVQYCPACCHYTAGSVCDVTGGLINERTLQICLAAGWSEPRSHTPRFGKAPVLPPAE